MEKYELGLNKKSFSLFFNGGEIWCEHLDSLYDKQELLKQKFNQDLIQIGKPSTSSFIAVSLGQTMVDTEIIKFILNAFTNLKKPLCKVVFVGLNSKGKKYIKQQNENVAFSMECIDDFEKAKEWLI